METAEQNLTEVAPMLPEMDTQGKPVVRYITTRITRSPEVTIIREKHPGTGERRFSAEVLGVDVAKDQPLKRLRDIIALAEARLEEIREERNAKIVAEWEARQAAQVQPAISDVVAETVVPVNQTIEAPGIAAPTWAPNGENVTDNQMSPDVPVDGHLMSQFDDSVTGGLDVE